jgi:hypothetical protein
MYKSVVYLITGLIFMLMIAAGLRHILSFVRGAITEGGIRGMVLWQTDWNDALTDAAAQHKRVLVEFARESSPNCHELAKKCWSRMDIVSATSDYVPVLVDIGTHPELAKQYGITTVPSIVVIDARSQAILHDGRDVTFSPDELLVWLKPDARPKLNISIPQDNAFDPQRNLFDTQKSPFSP